MTVCISLPQAPSRMAREEISKQIRALSPALTDVVFSPDGRDVVCHVAADIPAVLSATIATTARRLERTFRNIEGEVVASRRVDDACWHALDPADGVRPLGRGQVLLHGAVEEIARRVEQYLASLCGEWEATALRPPTLIDASVLRRCEYFRSFPQMVTFAAHLAEDREKVARFRQREIDHGTASPLADLAEITTCLSPAMCYHVYAFLQSTLLQTPGTAFTLQGRCFRHEGGGLTTTLTRLWEFTMREVVFIGTPDYVQAQRERALSRAKRLLEELDLSAEIRTASDPFYKATDTAAKQYIQVVSGAKLELVSAMPGDASLAIGSLNHHGDFFGRAFDIRCESGPAHSSCFAFGIERIVAALVARHGAAIDAWPPSIHDTLRQAVRV